MKRGRKVQRCALRILLFAVSAISLMLLVAPAPTRAQQPNIISGHVYVYGTQTPISGILVTLTQVGNTPCNPWGCPFATTVSDGSYTLSGPFITGGSTYVIGFNGQAQYFMSSAPNVLYDQWVDSITTDSHGDYTYNAYLSTSTVAWVPGAEIYSSTQSATVFYETSQSYSNSHTLGFSVVGGPVGASIGYYSTSSETISTSFGVQNGAQVYTQQQYALALDCNDQSGTGYCNTFGKTGVAVVGFSATVPHAAWGTASTTESLSPNSLPGNYFDFPVAANTPPSQPFRVDYFEQYSTTLEANLNVAWSAYGVGITVSTSSTATSTASKGIGYSIYNTSPTDHTYRAYPIFNAPNYYAGNEMHVWDITSPTPSQPSGPTYVQIYYTYTYSTSATDPNGRSLQYRFDWGDGSQTTTGWYASGATASASHWWGHSAFYNVQVQAYNGILWSPWSPVLTVDVSGGNCPPICSPAP